MNPKPLLFVGAALVLMAIGPIGMAQTGPATAPPPKQEEPLQSRGLFVTLARITQVTDTGLKSIPQGALVTVVENGSGQKFAAYRQLRLPIADMTQLSNDPTLIAKTSTTAGAANQTIAANADAAPKSKSDETIQLDAQGNLISRTKTVVVTDAAGNKTTVVQGKPGISSPEKAARIAAAEQRIRQQRELISDFKDKGRDKIVSNYQSKLKDMNDLLLRMEMELARIKAQ